jgi:UDP:flavonoid glycosyltransferase YjiC (YdhE family)
VTRDISIARALRTLVPGVSISWLAADAARDALVTAGEPLVPEATSYTTGAAAIEATAQEFVLNLASFRGLLRGESRARIREFVTGVYGNVAAFRQVTSRLTFDLVVGDETFELARALFSNARSRNPALKNAPFALITDFIGVEPTTRSPLEHLFVRVLNRAWVGLLRDVPRVCDHVLFVGELEDVPDAPFGYRLPNRRALAREVVDFVGYILPFDPADFLDRDRARRRLGYGNEPTVICAVGGTSVGTPLLRLCADACPLVRARVPDLRFILVCGPRIPAASVRAPAGAEVWGYVPNLYEHFAACDLAVVQAGGTTTLELTALRRPFLYVPLEQHFEQQFHVASRLRRHGAGVRVDYSATSPQALATAILDHLGSRPHYPPIATDGAMGAARILARHLGP